MLTMAISGEKQFGMDGYTYYLGLEVSPFNFVDLRIGYVEKPDESLYYTSGGRYGLGLKIGSFGIDYVTSPSLSALRHHQVTFRLRLQRDTLEPGP